MALGGITTIHPISDKYVRKGGNKLDTWIIVSSPERYRKGAHRY